MNKEFVWTDELVKKFAMLLERPASIKRCEELQKIFEQFKASHTPEVKGVDWEIISFIEKEEVVEEGDDPFILPVNTIPSCYKLEMYLASDSCFNIHSVRRKVDGEVFTVGDNCFHGPIKRFNLRGETITADFEYGDVGCTKLLSELSKPIQRTPLPSPDSLSKRIHYLEERVDYIEKVLKIEG